MSLPSNIINPSDENIDILFENEDIKVLWHKGISNFLLITFGDLVTLAQGNNFFADTPVKKLGINCIGFMAKRPNWFPHESMSQAIYAIKHITHLFKEKITYGGSMGGYAAIKYSSRLKATSIISFCPQWSLDASECDGNNPGYQSFYVPSMKDMSIKTNDISGSLFILYDPYYKEDAFHASKIKKLYPQSNMLHIRSTDHYVTGVLAGTENLNSIITSVIKNDIYALSIIVNSIRKSHPRRLKTILLRLEKRHPIFFDSLLNSERVKNSLTPGELICAASTALDVLIKERHYAKAANAAIRLSTMDIGANRTILLKNLSNKLVLTDKFYSARLLTSHKKIIFYSVIYGTLLQDTATELSKLRADLIPVSTSHLDKGYALSIYIDGKPHFFMLSPQGSLEVVDRYTAQGHKDRIILVNQETNRHVLTLKVNQHFLTAEPDGSISYNRTEAKGWEEYKLSSGPE
ncbi:hypothetical protein [Pseudomonas syringae]|nr:hypothetical protein [Pseudomonas syringae]